MCSVHAWLTDKNWTEDVYAFYKSNFHIKSVSVQSSCRELRTFADWLQINKLNTMDDRTAPPPPAETNEIRRRS